MCGCGSEEGRKVTGGCSCERCGVSFLEKHKGPFRGYKEILFPVDNTVGKYSPGNFLERQ